MNVLIALDGSPITSVILDHVLGLNWSGDTKFKVISVLEPLHPEYAGWQGNFLPLAMEAQAERSKALKEIVAGAREKLTERFGDRVDSEICEGYAKDKIIECAQTFHAELIVLGSHGKKGLERFLLGSISEAVLADSPCSVEVVKAK